MGPQVFPNRRLVCRIPPFPLFPDFPFPFPREMPFCFSDPTEITSPQEPRQASVEGATPYQGRKTGSGVGFRQLFSKFILKFV